MADERFSLKDHLFNRDTVSRLAGWFVAADAGFSADNFIEEVMAELPSLELKQRISLIADVLANYLPSDFSEAADRILPALPPPLDPNLSDDDFGEFIIAPLGEVVATRGIGPEHRQRSLILLGELTKRFSMEGAIRPFLDLYPEETMAHLTRWAEDQNYHVRRLVSEGTRPLLPWAPRIKLEPGQAIPLLDTLHSDPTRYVTRSVANHLNDISKTDPELVIKTLRRWRKSGQQDAKELAWITRHSLRTLVKEGDPATMEFLGFSPRPDVSVDPISLLHQVPLHIGDVLEFEFGVTARQDEKVIIDYLIDFAKEDGTTRSKVFKLKQTSVARGETKLIKKRHPLRADATTFTLFPGTHRLTIQINGNRFASTIFELVD